MSSTESPIFIGGTGGSGTRLLVDILRKAGVYMGTELNASNDASAFRGFYSDWTNHYLSRCGLRGLGSPVPRMIRDFQRAVDRHLKEWPGSLVPWGCKNPRSILLLSFLYTQYPSLRYVHVLRDGRDMAFSANQNQLHLHGLWVIERNWVERTVQRLRSRITPSRDPDPLRSMQLWSTVNLEAAQFADRVLGRNYHCLRFEDLCQDPGRTIHELCAFLDIPEKAAVEEAGRLVRPPKSLGRWKLQPRDRLEQIQEVGHAALDRFGYLNPAGSAEPLRRSA